MKKIFFIVTILYASSLFGQKEKYQLTLKPNYSLDFIRISSEGEIVLGVKKNMISSKSQDYRIIRLDNHLNVSYDKKVGSPNFVPITIFSKSTRKIFSRHGKYLLLGESLVDEDGNVKPYEFNKSSANSISGDIEPFLKVFSDDYYSFLGRKKGRINEKKTYEAGDLYLFSRKNSDYSENTYRLAFPDIGFVVDDDESKKQKLKIVGKLGFDDGFYMFSVKDEPIHTSVEYFIAKYAYDSELLSKTQLKLKLDNVFFLTSKYGRILRRIDNKDGSYYFYGTYSDKKEKSSYYRALYKGFFISKFNAEGVNLWHKQYPITDEDFRKAKSPTFCAISSYQKDEENLIISLLDYDYTKKMWLYNIDKNSGDIAPITVISHKRKVHSDGYGGQIYYDFGDEEYKKFIFDKEAYILLKTNTDFREYVKKLPNEKLFFTGNLSLTGDIMIYQYDKKRNIYTFLHFRK